MNCVELMREAYRLRFENPEQAQQLYCEAIESFRNGSSRLTLIQALKGMGQIARDLRKNDLALRVYEEAVTLCRAERDQLLLAHTVRHLGDIHSEMRRHDLAEPCYEEALAIYRTHARASLLDRANAVRPYALLKENGGAMDEAKQLWTEAKDLYAAANVPEGVKDCSRHLNILHQDRGIKHDRKI